MKGRRCKRLMWTILLSLAMWFVLVPSVLADDSNSMTTQDIISLVEYLENEGQMTNAAAVRALTIHLTAVKHYEQQGEAEKVVEHMNSFKLLLDHHLNLDFLSESAYDMLVENTDALIKRWDDLVIVQDGQANAVIILDGEEETNRNAPLAWNRFTNYAGTVERSENQAYTGAASLLIYGMVEGGIWQHIEVESGSISAQLQYYTDVSNNAGDITIGMNLRDENYKTLATLRTGRVNLSDTSGEWATITLEGEVPETVNDAEIVIAQITVTARGDENTQIYIDDYIVSQNNEAQNLVENSGFETINHPLGNTFVDYVKESTGAVLPIYLNEPVLDDYEGVKMYIGHSRTEDAERHQDILQDMNEHGFIIDAQDGIVTILGTTPRATEYGVYDFLERYVGVRWLMPGPDGKHVPEQSTIKVPRELIEEEPFTISRHFFMNGSTNQEWAKWNRMHDNIQFHHNLDELFDPEIFADHPEYYPGGIVPSSSTGWQPCFNNETAQAAIQRIIEYFDANPNASSYSLGANDGGGYCAENPDHPNYTGERNSIGYLNMSNLYYPWVNQIAEGVTQVHPDKYFGLLAYSRVYDPPTNEDGTPYKLHPNVVPYITLDRMTWIDPPIGDEGRTHTERWTQSAENLGFYEYLYGSQYNLPRIYLNKMAENYQYSKNHSVIGHVAEIYPNWGEGAKPWISTKLQWNPDQNVEELAREWYELAVGEEAAPYLEQYYDYWEQFWTTRIFESEWYLDWFNSSPRRNYLDFFEPTYLKAVTKDDFSVTRSLMEQVAALAKTEKQKARAELLLRSFEFYEASALSYPKGGEIEVPADEQAALTMLDELKTSYEMAVKRNRMKEEFREDPVQINVGRSVRGIWDGMQPKLLEALQTYIANEPDNKTVEEQLNQFLAEVGYENISANAVKTTAAKEDILEALDFSQGPWTEAQPFNNFLIMDSNQKPPVETNVYLLWDDENLYVGYENFDDDLSQMIVSDEAPNGWWGSGGDDSVETFVTDDPAGEYLGFFANPNKIKFARTRGSVDTSVEWEVSADIGTDRWNIIQVIPFAEIDIDPTSTESLQALFFRNYHGTSVYIGWDGGAPWRESSFNKVYLVD